MPIIRRSDCVPLPIVVCPVVAVVMLESRVARFVHCVENVAWQSQATFNPLLRLGRPVGAVTLSRWGWRNERWIWGARAGGGLKPNFYQLPRPWSPWASSPFKEKTHMVEPGIEPGTSWLVVKSSDHQAKRLVVSKSVCCRNLSTSYFLRRQWS